MHDQHFLTPLTMTTVLAYCHHYTPNFLSGRCLSATHLRQLNSWLGWPQGNPRSARSQPRLAAHLALAHAAGLLQVAAGCWQPGVYALSWLQQTWVTQLQRLRHARQDAAQWGHAWAACCQIIFGRQRHTRWPAQPSGATR